MPRQIDYYFTLLSPWTYLGHATFLDIAARHGCTVRYHPVPLRSVFDETGGLPLAKRHPVRQRYRIFELQRWRAKRGLPLILFPAHFPFDVSLADRVALAIAQQGGDPATFIGEVLASVWALDEDMSEPEQIARCARQAGFEPGALLDAARGEAVSGLYEASIAEAVKVGVFGAPSYVLDGEIFWGQDRLDLLEDALVSGRPPYSADATS